MSSDDENGGAPAAQEGPDQVLFLVALLVCSFNVFYAYFSDLCPSWSWPEIDVHPLLLSFALDLGLDFSP